MPYRFQYNPRQPRVPAGQHGGGQWTREGYGFCRPSEPPQHFRDDSAAQKAREAAIAIYNWLSARAEQGRQPVIEFKAREYQRDGTDPFQPTDVVELTRKEVERICNRFAQVQSLTDAIAASERPFKYSMSPTEYGTRIHSQLRRIIDQMADPNLKAEISYLKAKEDMKEADIQERDPEKGDYREARYGGKNTIRVDVFERSDPRTVCVYDIKTGASGLSAARYEEMRLSVSRAFGPNIQHLVIVEVRPTP